MSAGHRRAALASAIALAILTIVHIVIGEMVPKGIALQHPDRGRALHGLADAGHARASSTRSSGCRTASRSSRCGCSASGASENVHEQVYTPEELQLIVEESERGGALRA